MTRTETVLQAFIAIELYEGSSVGMWDHTGNPEILTIPSGELIKITDEYEHPYPLSVKLCEYHGWARAAAKSVASLFHAKIDNWTNALMLVTILEKDGDCRVTIRYGFIN